MVREAAIPALSLNGRLAAKVIRQKIKERIAVLADEGAGNGDGTGSGGRVPGLGIVMANGWVCGWVCVGWCFGGCAYIYIESDFRTCIFKYNGVTKCYGYAYMSIS